MRNSGVITHLFNFCDSTAAGVYLTHCTRKVKSSKKAIAVCEGVLILYLNLIESYDVCHYSGKTQRNSV